MLEIQNMIRFRLGFNSHYKLTINLTFPLKLLSTAY